MSEKKAIDPPTAVTPEPRLLDATGLRCPMPVLRARKLMRAIPVGETLVVLATDDAAPGDFEAFCRESGHGFGGVERTGDTYRIRIRKTR